MTLALKMPIGIVMSHESNDPILSWLLFSIGLRCTMYVSNIILVVDTKLY